VKLYRKQLDAEAFVKIRAKKQQNKLKNAKE